MCHILSNLLNTKHTLCPESQAMGGSGDLRVKQCSKFSSSNRLCYKSTSTACFTLLLLGLGRCYALIRKGYFDYQYQTKMFSSYSVGMWWCCPWTSPSCDQVAQMGPRVDVLPLLHQPRLGGQCLGCEVWAKAQGLTNVPGSKWDLALLQNLFYQKIEVKHSLI